MATNPVDHFWGDGGQDSGSVPPVEPADLRSIWEMQNGFQALHPGQQIAIQADAYQRACGPEADVRAVYERVSQLWMMQEVGMLAPWLRDGVLDDAVFQVTATIQMSRMQIGVVYEKAPFGPEDFIKQVEKRIQS